MQCAFLVLLLLCIVAGDGCVIDIMNPLEAFSCLIDLFLAFPFAICNSMMGEWLDKQKRKKWMSHFL